MSESLRYLSPDEYRLWDDLVEASPYGTVCSYSWWLKAVCGDVCVLGYFDNGRLVAGIPVHVESRVGVSMCTMPALTVTWGVVIESLYGKRVAILSREMEILTLFARQLARHNIFFQKFHPSLQNWLPFYWAGFRQTNRFTYVLDDITDLDRIWNEMAHDVRGEIRKAQRLGIEVVPCGIDQVFQAEVDSFKRQSRAAPRTRVQLQRLYEAAKEHNASECFAARDRNGRVHAANLLVWDRKRAYFLAGGADPNERTSGATSLVIWHLIRFASQRTKVFDFEGSVNEAIERLYRHFGAQQVTYSWIMKFPVWMRTYLTLRRKI